MIISAAKWLAGRMMRLVPEGILGRLLPGKFRFDARNTPRPPNAPDARIRLFIAPVNYAGQGHQWARAVVANIDGASAVNMVCRIGSDFRHPADNVVPLGYYAASKRWQRMQRDAVTAGFTHVMIESEKQPFGAVLDETVQGQARRLQAHGVSVMMLCHGSDIRLPSRHITNNPGSPFLDSLAAVSPVLERIAAGNRKLLDELGLPVFVSTPDLLLDVPYATWLPVVVDPNLWRSDVSPFTREIPVVAHAPSSGSVKGSEVIDPLLRRLDAEGAIAYRRVEALPFEEMPQLYRDADIVIDQLRLGDYGVSACEAMAAGRIVVGHVSERSRSYVKTTTGRELPIVEATVDDLEAVLRQIVADRERSRARAKDGVEFVSEVHDGRLAADVLRPFLV